MLKQGIHPKIVQERLGHSTIAITLDTYSHVTLGLQQAAAESFDNLINQKINANILKRNPLDERISLETGGIFVIGRPKHFFLEPVNN